MVHDKLHYGNFLADAMRQVVKRALHIVAKDGLQNGHVFYISFDTNHKRLIIPDWLYKKYPEQMTIVLENKFWNLQVKQRYFCVDLQFNQVDCTLTIPFDAVIQFSDPSVNFSLQFQIYEEDHKYEQETSAINEEDIDEYFDHIKETMDQKFNTAQKLKDDKKTPSSIKNNVIDLKNFRKD